MEPLVFSPPPSRRTRRWRVPPPLTHGRELLEGGEILAELSGETSVLLWKAMRNVLLWAAVPARPQGELFAPGARERRLQEISAPGLDPTLRPPLERLAALLGNAGGVGRESIALACQHIAQWADAQGASGTALAFTQAAALTCPNDARLAFAVGRLARQRAEHARSESWFRRAIMLGRQSGDWETYALSYLGLGNLFVQRGNFPQARRAHLKGLRAAQRKGLREAAGRALHDLMVVETECGNPERAQECAAAALRAYGAGNPRLVALAHDTAALWASQGHFARALPVFQAALPHLSSPRERLLVLSNLARAAAGAGQPAQFEGAWVQVWASVEGEANGEGNAQALLNLARGATLRDDWSRAEQSAARAAEIATARGEAQIRFEAEALLASLRGGRPHAHRTAHAPQAESRPEQAESLATQLVRSLRLSLQGV